MLVLQCFSLELAAEALTNMCFALEGNKGRDGNYENIQHVALQEYFFNEWEMFLFLWIL
jgi:hypothetical protein